jgi:hypothetical protein
MTVDLLVLLPPLLLEDDYLFTAAVLDDRAFDLIARESDLNVVAVGLKKRVKFD